MDMAVDIIFGSLYSSLPDNTRMWAETKQYMAKKIVCHPQCYGSDNQKTYNAG